MTEYKINSVFSATIMATIAVSSCTTNPYTGQKQLSKTAAGGLLGATAGGLIGAATGSDSSEKARRHALRGALIGGTVGAGVGIYMDHQEAQIRQQLQGTGVSVTRNGNDLILNMPSDITFSVNSSTVLPKFKSTLNSVALVLNKYNKTNISITGHTDSDGSDEHNQKLSYSRAYSVAKELNANSVTATRIKTYGQGESSPVSPNSTSEGKARNRRVELKIVPREDQFN